MNLIFTFLLSTYHNLLRYVYPNCIFKKLVVYKKVYMCNLKKGTGKLRSIRKVFYNFGPICTKNDSLEAVGQEVETTNPF